MPDFNVIRTIRVTAETEDEALELSANLTDSEVVEVIKLGNDRELCISCEQERVFTIQSKYADRQCELCHATWWADK